MIKIKLIIFLLFINNVFGQKDCNEISVAINKCLEFEKLYSTSVDTSCICYDGIKCLNANNSCDDTTSVICNDFCKNNGYSCTIEENEHSDEQMVCKTY